MKILLAASEAVPFCKTGGLADVAGALARVLSKDHEVALFLPRYRGIEKAGVPLEPVPGSYLIPIGDGLERASLVHSKCGGADVYFVDSPKYFDRDGLYGAAGADYEDNDERFVFFCRAVLEGAKFVDFRPDVVHCHDWQAALLPAYLKLLYNIDAFFARTGTLLTIHNLAYQGLFSKDTLFLAGFGWGQFTPDRLEYYGGFSLLKAGLVYADRLNTVSPTYAREIQTAEFGRGLDGVLRKRSDRLSGILNGIDVETWDPKEDALLPERYGAADAGKGKAACKAALQKECGLAERRDAPLVGIVSRLDPQKGLDLALEAVQGIVDRGAQLAVLGSGDPALTAGFLGAAKRHPRSVHFRPGFDEPFAHKIYGASDLFLMPSRFEPCGLGQLIAMRYGALPVVTNTGGLADTVHEDGAKPTGFVAPRASGDQVWPALERAFGVYARPEAWAARRRVAMESDFSWGRSAKAYVDLYRI